MADTPENKKWTLMFYMASDNPLVISVVSQLKALKAAGYDPNVNVIAQFDPYAQGTPTHIFDVNLIHKSKNRQNGPNIGFGADSTVRNLIEDKLWRHETDRSGERLIRQRIKDVMANREVPVEYNPPIAPELNGYARDPGRRRYEPDPYTCLHTFLDFCAEEYKADHYMLFILGHGVVVGNDIFLYDTHAEKNSITLTEMGDALNDFKDKIEEQENKGTLELLSFNSCSVSSLEVAYELKKTAKYMLASQGPTFVGSWPYREILMRIFQDRSDIAKLRSDIFDYCVQNSSDFLLAGYSYQLTLCDLRRMEDLRKPMEELSLALIKGLENEKDPTSKEVIVDAHWQAQSFFQEMYTDLYDFCECVMDHPAIKRDSNENPEPPPLSQELGAIKLACEKVKKLLQKPGGKDQRGTGVPIIDATDFVGPAYQYSHGLSVYFPWTQPSEDSHILQQYKNYKFSEDFTDSWFDFLKVYFDKTLREPRNEPRRTIANVSPDEQDLQEDIASLIYKGEGPLGGQALNKTDPKDRTGGECECPSIKNYPRDTRSRKERRSQAQPVSVGETPASFAV
jgi:hypothetical protein